MINMLNIPNYAPSILIDWNTSDVPYVRTFCNFETTDMERLRNNPYDTWIKHENIVFPVDYDLENVIPTYGDRYKTTRMNGIDIWNGTTFQSTRSDMLLKVSNIGISWKVIEG